MGVNFNFEFPPDLIRQFEQLGAIDDYAPKMLDAATPIIEKNVKAEMAPHRVTDAMMESVKRTKAEKTKNGGFYAVVRPTGVDKNGVRNMEKLAWLEYGTIRQPAIPVLTKAINNSQQPVREKMQEVFEEEVRVK